MGGAEGEGEGGKEADTSLSTESTASAGFHDSENMTWAKTKSWAPN